MKKKTLVIIYNENDWNVDAPLGDSPETRSSFEDFYAFAEKHNIFVCRASIDWYNRSTKTFSKVWSFLSKKWEKIERSVSPDAVFDKISGKYDYALFNLKQEMSETFPVINPPLFRTSFDNKLSQYLAFSQFMPKSLLVENNQQLHEVIEKISTDFLVLKEIYGSGGKQVLIGEKYSINPSALSYPLLAQEFIKTSGVPNISNPGDIADLRLVYIGEKLIYALSRIAKRGSLFTNFHQGANAVLVPIDKIPQKTLEIAKRIQEKLSIFQKTNYSLDFMFSTNGESLFIEMNTTPGFDLLRIVGTQEIKELYYRELLLSIFDTI